MSTHLSSFRQTIITTF
jgi:hypothetical protein